jgi:hypothetical protein
MQEMITQKENANAVKEILERLYYNDIVECDGEISGIGKLFLLHALIENHLKMIELPYACKKNENTIVYTMEPDPSVYATILLKYERTGNGDEIETTLDMEVCLKKDIMIQEKERVLDLLKFIDRINATSNTGVVSTIDSIYADNYCFQAKGIMIRQRYKRLCYPFKEITDDFPMNLKGCFTNLADIDALLTGKTTLSAISRHIPI